MMMGLKKRERWATSLVCGGQRKAIVYVGLLATLAGNEKMMMGFLGCFLLIGGLDFRENFFLTVIIQKKY